MKLLHPIVPKEGHDVVRVVVIFHGNCRHTIHASIDLAKSYFDIVCAERTSTVLFCNSRAEIDRHNSLAAALAKIENDEVDIVIASDLSRISRTASSALDFISRCVNSGVRVLTFEDCFDSMDDDWQDRLTRAYAMLSDPTTEGGQP